MSSWNELHYARAQEFVRLIADALTVTTPNPAAGHAPSKALAGALFRSAAPAPSLPAPGPAAPKSPAATTPSPTAASVFNKIPWKK